MSVSKRPISVPVSSKSRQKSLPRQMAAAFGPRPSRLALETRILFDAAAAVAGADAFVDDVSDLPEHGPQSQADQDPVLFSLFGAGLQPLSADSDPEPGAFYGAENTAEDPVVSVGEDDEPAAVLGSWDISGSGYITVEVSGADNGTLSHADSQHQPDEAGALQFTGTVAEVNSWLAGVRYQYQTENQSQVGDSDHLVLTFTTYTEFVDPDSGDSSFIPATYSETQQIEITPQNDAPEISSGSGLQVNEGGSLVFGAPVDDPSGLGFSHDLLGISDVDNLAEQVIIKLETVPDKADGKLVLNKGGGSVTLEAGSTLSVADLEYLTFKHSGKQVLPVDEVNPSVTFTVTIDDGAGGRLTGHEVSIELLPVNQVPSISGQITIIQGEGPVSIGQGGKLPILANGTVDRGRVQGADPDDTVLTYEITRLPQVGELFYNGVLLQDTDPGAEGYIGALTVTDLDKLTYAYPPELEPHEFAASNGGQPVVTVGIRATDQGGGTGVPASSGDLDIKITVLDNNNDPILTINEQQDYEALRDGGDVSGSSFVVTTGMLNVSDPDSFDNNVIFRITSAVDANAAGYFTVNGQLLDEGASFSLQDLKDGNIQYHLRYLSANERIDSFSFTVTDSGKGIVFPSEGLNRHGCTRHPFAS